MNLNFLNFKSEFYFHVESKTINTHQVLHVSCDCWNLLNPTLFLPLQQNSSHLVLLTLIQLVHNTSTERFKIKLTHQLCYLSQQFYDLTYKILGACLEDSRDAADIIFSNKLMKIDETIQFQTRRDDNEQRGSTASESICKVHNCFIARHNSSFSVSRLWFIVRCLVRLLGIGVASHGCSS